MSLGIIISFIIVFIIGLVIGISLMCFMKTAKEADLQIILLKIMDQLKQDQKEAQIGLVRRTGRNISYGRYKQASKTIELIKELYGGIS